MSPSQDWSVRTSRGLVLVTGGSGTIGQAICRALVADGWGVAVGYVSRDRALAFVESLRRGAADPGAGRAIAVPLDLTDAARTRSTADRLSTANGVVDAVVFNGGSSSAAPFHLSDPTNWAADVAVNFLGTVRLSERFLPGMLAAGWGRLIGITSEAAKSGDAKHASYSGAKAAQAAYLTAVARRVTGTGVTANAVAPGPIESPLLRNAFASAEAAERAVTAMLSTIPVRRLGAPEEIAAAVRFFLTAGPGVSGVQLSVAGGITMQ